jgi:hypothetical protein
MDSFGQTKAAKKKAEKLQSRNAGLSYTNNAAKLKPNLTETRVELR